MPDLPQDLVAALSERYRLREEIGAGGMATVYLADDLRHGRPVAIKVLKPELAVAVGSNRFLREIEVAASLTHPHVLPLHDSGEEAGFLYYVMPFIEGQSLRERLDHEGPLPVSEALRLFRQIVDALAAAHARGIVHRDVKPANILLTGSHALVADFGVAKAVHQVTDRTRLTSMGVAMGTPRYMSPEQASGDPETDHRSDLFAAGAVAYEMMTGRAPFDGENTRAVFAALLAKTPVAPRVLRDTVPQAASDLVMRCLEKEAADRPQSAEDLLAELDAAVTPPSGVAATGAARSPLLRRSLGSAAVAVLLVAGIAGWRWNQSRVAEREARESIPTVLQLVNENRLTEAARLAEDVEASVGEDPVLRTLWPRMSSQFRIVTNPPGAAITYRPYDSQDEWRDLGTTPFESDRFPVGAHHFRLRLDGFEPVDRVRSLIPQNLLGELRNAGVDYLSDPSYVIDEELVPSGEIPDGMVSVAGGVYSAIPVLGFGSTQPSPIPPFLIDRTEVTNEAYARFVADGGYDNPAIWGAIVRDGQPLSLDEARSFFLDETGRLGPSTWSLGQVPSGTDDLPVGGVSWFEADAYCRWAGKELPTLYHWARAALPSSDAWIPFTPLLAAASNIQGTGPEAVGSRPGSVGVSGALDLAGNVREWLSTPTGSNRIQAGGSWSDPAYRIHDAIAWDPWTRSPENGFRCADYQGVELPEPLLAGLEYPEQDLTPATMPDDVYRTLLDFHRYDSIAPLASRVDSTFTVEWGATVEWVSVEGAYGERLPIRLHVPVDGEPPYPAIVLYAGGNVLRSNQIEDPTPPLNQLIRSGRVLVEPIYDGTFQRNDGRTLPRLGSPGSREVLFANWVKDLGRALDYLEERPDVDHNRVSYMGISLGAALAPKFLAFEPRFRSAVLYSGGLGALSPQETLDEYTSLAARATMPVLMLGGEADFSAPVTHQEGLFNAFGAPPEDKIQRFYESGHWPLPMGEVLRETVDFLDRYDRPGAR